MGMPFSRTMQNKNIEFSTREVDGKRYIDAYFAVFDGFYEIGPGMLERIGPNAFNRSLEDDIRALTNHDTTLVLGRTKSGTLSLEIRERGLWGTIEINPNDRAAMDTYARVQRGDVDGCSFGFDIISESVEERPDGVVIFQIDDLKLYEVSICTFPAYVDTVAEARAKDIEKLHESKIKAWKATALKKLKGEESC